MSLLVAALAIGGCGSGGSPEPREPLSAQEREVAEGYLALVRDFSAGRYRDFCGALTPESLEVTSHNIMGVEMSCPEWAEENAQILGDTFREQAERAKVLAVEIDGDEALVHWSSESGENSLGDQVEANRIGGRWRYTAVTPSS